MKRKTGAFKLYLRFIASVYRNNKLFVLSKVFISVLAGLLSVVTAVLPKYMADAILIDNSEYGFIAYVLLYVLAQLIIGAVYNFVEIYINKSLIVVKAKCTEEVLERLYRMVYANYEQPERRNCIERAFQFATQTGVASFNTFLTLIGTFITFTSYVYIIARHNWVTLVLLSISIVATYILQKRKAEYEYTMKRSLTTDERRTGYYKSAMLDKSLAKDIRYSGAFALLKQCYGRESKNYSDKLFRKSKKSYYYNQAISAIQLGLVFAVMVSFGQRLFHDSMTYGDYTMSVNVSMSFTSLVFQLISHITSVYTAVLDGTNYNEFLGITESTKQAPVPNRPDIEFRNVSFKYGTEDRWALKDFTYTFRYGKRYSIIGENGSGKSTLLKLLLGMYVPDRGTVRIGGTDIRELAPESLYSLYAVVFQDFRLLDGVTLQENLQACGKHAEESELYGVLSAVGLRERLKDDGGDSPLRREYSRTFDNDGIELSGGEKQKLAIARALLKDAPVVVLDEPTSAFDEISKDRLFDSVFRNCGKTILFVTHHMELTAFADEILTMKDGTLAGVRKNDVEEEG